MAWQSMVVKTKHNEQTTLVNTMKTLTPNATNGIHKDHFVPQFIAQNQISYCFDNFSFYFDN